MININPCNSYKLVDMSGAADFCVANQIHTGKMQMAPDVDVEELVNTKDDTAVDLTQGGGAGGAGCPNVGRSALDAIKADFCD